MDSSEKVKGIRAPPRLSPKKLKFASAPSIWTFTPDVRPPPMATVPPVETSVIGLTRLLRAIESVKSRPSDGSRWISCSDT
jgi:hypothetical protein